MLGKGRICQSKQSRDCRLYRGSCGSNPEIPTKIHSASKSVSLSCGRLCKSVGDISHWRNLYSKGKSQLLATAEDLYGKALPRSNVLPLLVCRPCERRLTNFRKFKITVSESQASFEVKVKRCLEESPSAPHTFKSLKARRPFLESPGTLRANFG